MKESHFLNPDGSDPTMKIIAMVNYCLLNRLKQKYSREHRMMWVMPLEQLFIGRKHLLDRDVIRPNIKHRIDTIQWFGIVTLPLSVALESH